MDDIDRAVLTFAAAHRAVTDGQLAVLVGGSTLAAERNVARLSGEGLLARARVTGSDLGCLMITEPGLAAIGSRLAVAGWEMRGLRRTLAAGWVSLRAQDGRYKDLTGGVLSRRELEAHDRELASAEISASASRAYGIRVGGSSAAHASGLHHPDLLMVFRAGWVAAEIVLGAAPPPRLAALLTAYGTDDRFQRVVFLTETERVAGAIERAAVKPASQPSCRCSGWSFPDLKHRPEPRRARRPSASRVGLIAAGIQIRVGVGDGVGEQRHRCLLPNGVVVMGVAIQHAVRLPAVQLDDEPQLR